jgi:hypothetical protein
MSFVFQPSVSKRTPNFYAVIQSINTDGRCDVLVPLLIVSLETLLPEL